MSFFWDAQEEVGDGDEGEVVTEFGTTYVPLQTIEALRSLPPTWSAVQRAAYLASAKLHKYKLTLTYAHWASVVFHPAWKLFYLEKRLSPLQLSNFKRR